MLEQEIPLEVVEHVFHRGCATSIQLRLSLCLVSSWTRRLALPYLYSVVTLPTHPSLTSFHRVIVKGPRDSSIFPAPRLCVRSLWLDPISNVLIDIFNVCENLEYISVREENLMWLIRPPLGQTRETLGAPLVPASNQDLHLWVAKGRSRRFYPLDSIITTSPSPFLSKVTHLVLDCSTGYNVLKNIRLFDRLAHLAVTYDGSPSQDLQSLVVALRAAPIRDISCVLMLLVDMLTTAQRVETLSWVAGLDLPQKIHVLPSRQGNLRMEWEEELKTGVNVWEKAGRNSRWEIFGGRRLR